MKEDAGGHSQSQGDGGGGGGGRGNKKRGIMHALLAQPPPAGGGRGKRERPEDEQQLAAAVSLPQPSPLVVPVGPPLPLLIVLTAQDAVRRREEVGSGVVVEEMELELEMGEEGPLGPSFSVAVEDGVCGPSKAAPPLLPLVRFAFRRGGGEGRRVLGCVGASAGEKGEEDADARLRRLLREWRRRLGPGCADPQGAVARARVAVAMAAARAAGTEQEVRCGFDFDMAQMGKGMHRVRI